MVQRRRRVRLAVLTLLLASAVGGGALLFFPSSARATGTLTLYFNNPPVTCPGAYYVPRYKAPYNSQDVVFNVSGSNDGQGSYAWSGLGVYLDSYGNTSTGQQAHFRSTATGTANTSCQQSGVPDHPGETVTATSMPVCVFDADLTSPDVGDADEETIPTFIGPDVSKTFTINVSSLSDMPTPPTPGNSDSDPHWVLTLGVENGMPGAAFYDATTGLQLTNLSWGWTLVPGHMDWNTYQWVNGYWAQLPGGLTPPSQVIVGLPSADQQIFGAPLMVNLTLHVQDYAGSAAAYDRILVIPVKITQYVAHDVDPVRKLWFFGWRDEPTDSLKVDQDDYSEEMNLTVTDITNVIPHALYAWNKTAGGTHIKLNGQSGDLGQQQDMSAVEAESNSPSGGENDVEVVVQINGKDAAKTKLTVYAPTKLKFWVPPSGNFNRTDSWWGGGTWQGFQTIYQYVICDQFWTHVPHTVKTNETFGPFNPPGCDWTSTTQDPSNFFGATDDWGHADDPYGKQADVNSPGLHPTPVSPFSGQAGTAVGTEQQYYHVGTYEVGKGIICNCDGSGTGQTICWYLGRARQQPEPPGTLVSNP